MHNFLILYMILYAYLPTVLNLFCSVSGYFSSSINDGPGCLMLRCPDPSCCAAIGRDMINNLASDEDKKRYARYLLRSYIEDNKQVGQN